MMKNYTNPKLQLIMASTISTMLMLTACVSNKPSYHKTKTIIKNENNVPNYYKVKKGDNVANIAKKYRLNYRKVAKLNKLNSEYLIHTGQWLMLWDSNKVAAKKKVYIPQNKPVNSTTIAKVKKPINVKKSSTGAGVVGYQYPTSNPVIKNFSNNYSDGMWFSGNVGDPVHSTNSGQVMYSGKGLPEFGNLIMIRHDDNYISAYAHNESLLVQEGDYVISGQKIATMGSSGTTIQVGLQFQVRRDGVAIDPKIMLGKR